MFVYRDEKGRITEVRGSVHEAELQRLRDEEKWVDVEKASGETGVDSALLGPDQDLIDALEEQKQPGPPLPEPESQVVGESPAEDEEVEEVEVPSTHEAKAVWVDYAVSQGYDREEAEAMTKADLVETFSG